MFFVSGLAKLLFIAGLFFAASRLSGSGAVFFVQGLTMIYLGMAGAGLRRAARNRSHGT
jgi:hypothetical protein